MARVCADRTVYRGATPEQCSCTQRIGTLARHPVRIRCTPSIYCGTRAEHPEVSQAQLASAAYVSVLHMDEQHLRPQWKRSGGQQWLLQLRRLTQLWTNLQRVNTSLPFICLTTGQNATSLWRNDVLTAFASRLKRAGIQFVPWMSLPVPPWANREHRSTFAKLAVVNASYALGKRLIYLDTDTFVLQNIDHLAQLPRNMPAFVMRPDLEVINTGLFSVQADKLMVEAMGKVLRRYLTRSKPLHMPCAGADGGDQAVFLYFLSWALPVKSFFELPSKYNAAAWQFNQSDFLEHSGMADREAANSVPWCKRLLVVHKTLNLHKMNISPDCLAYFRQQLATLRGEARIDCPSRNHCTLKSCPC